MTVELVLLSRVAYRGVDVAGSGMRGLLALLAGELRTGCSTTRLVSADYEIGQTGLNVTRIHSKRP